MYEGAKPVFADIDPVTLNLDPEAARAAVAERTRALLPVHIFGYPADMQAFETIAAEHELAIVEDACEALGAVHRDEVPVGGRGHPAVFGFYANKQLTTGEGGMIVLADPGSSARSTPSATRGALRTATGSTTIASASTTACRISRARSASPSCSGWRRCSPPALVSPSATGRRSPTIEGLTLPCADFDGDARGWFVFIVQLPRGVDRDETLRTLADAGVQTKPYLPAIHLMRFYRERFGYREGQLPVCEDVAARSLALPFFPEMTDGEVARVVSELSAALGQA